MDDKESLRVAILAALKAIDVVEERGRSVPFQGIDIPSLAASTRWKLHSLLAELDGRLRRQFRERG